MHQGRRINCRFCKVDDWYHAGDAVVVGEVTIGAGANLWYGCVVRGDDAPIHIGARTNVQDLTMIHADPGKPLEIGEDVTIGHRAVVHCVRVGSGSLIGMGAILMEDVVIGPGSLVAAGALVPPGVEIPPHSLVRGAPGRVVRETTAEERRSFLRSAAKYLQNAEQFHGQYGH